MNEAQEKEVTKRDGTRQRFVSLKIYVSLRHAGASASTAKEVATGLAVEDKESTTSIRTKVVAALQDKDRKTADAYSTVRRLKAILSDAAGRGQVRIHPDTLRGFGIEAYSYVRVSNGDKGRLLRAFGAAEAGLSEARMSPEQIEELGAQRGAKLCIQ